MRNTRLDVVTAVLGFVRCADAQGAFSKLATPFAKAQNPLMGQFSNITRKLTADPDAIRMLRLLAGEADDPIHIRLSHYPLTDISKYEVLSYI